MRVGTTGARNGGRPAWGRRASVVTQVALTLVLLAAAGLLVRTVQGLQAPDPGHDGRRVVLFSMKPVRDGNVRYTDAEVRRLLRDLVQRAAALPGVAAASLIGSGEASVVPGTTVWRGGQTIVQSGRDDRDSGRGLHGRGEPVLFPDVRSAGDGRPDFHRCR